MLSGAAATNAALAARRRRTGCRRVAVACQQEAHYWLCGRSNRLGIGAAGIAGGTFTLPARRKTVKSLDEAQQEERQVRAKPANFA